MYLTSFTPSSTDLSVSCVGDRIIASSGAVSGVSTITMTIDEAIALAVGMIAHLPGVGLEAIDRQIMAVMVERHERDRDVPSEHSGYPHHPGYLHGCPACEERCFCAPGSAECVYGGEHTIFEGEVGR